MDLRYGSLPGRKVRAFHRWRPRVGEFAFQFGESRVTRLQRGNLMLGAITGDIVGSIYEHGNIKTKDFPFPPRKVSS